MGEVVGLRGIPVVDGRKPNEAMVDLVRDLLAKVESGEIQGLAFAVLYFDKSSGGNAAGVSGYSMVGRLEELKQRTLETLRS